MRSIGIDIGTFSAKVCVIDANKKGLFIERFRERIFVSTNPFDRNIEVIEFLRTELAGEDPLQTKFVGSLSQDLVSIHTKIFPFKDRIKIFRSLPYELEEETPFNPDDTVFDGRLIRFEIAQAEVLACASPKESIKKQLQLLTDSGVSPHLLTPEGIAFANHFEKWMEPIPVVPQIYDPSVPSELPVAPRHCESILQIGHTKTLLLVYEESKIVEIRCLSWGGDNIAKSIQNKYNLSYSEGLKQLQGNAFILISQENASPDQIFYSNVIADSVRELIRELRLVLMEIQATSNVTIQSMGITGGVSRLQNLAPFLTQGLEIPVNKHSFKNQYPLTHFELTQEIEASIGVALGLAIEGLRKPRNPSVSLLRGEFAIQSHALKNFLDTWGTTLKFVAFGVVLLYVYAGFRDSMALSMAEEASNVMTDQASALARLKGSKASESGIEKFISEKRKTIKELKEVEAFIGMNSALEVLKKINDASPGRATLRMEVRKMQIKDSFVRMEGFVSSSKETEMLQQSLKSLAKDLKIKTVPIQFSLPPGKIGFGFEFFVDRNVKLAKATEKKKETSGDHNENKPVEKVE